MMQVRSERRQWNVWVQAKGCALAKSIVRPLTSLVMLLLVFFVGLAPLFYAIDAHAMGPDDRGGPGGPGGPGGSFGGPGGAMSSGGPGPGGSMGFGGGNGAGSSDHGYSGSGRPPTSSNRGQGSGNRWNEEGFFDDSVSNLDHQKALAGVKSGRYRSLKDVILIVGIPPTSRIVRMELLNQGGVDVYSIIVRDASGRVERMTVDAATGQRIN